MMQKKEVVVEVERTTEKKKKKKNSVLPWLQGYLTSFEAAVSPHFQSTKLNSPQAAHLSYLTGKQLNNKKQ